MQTFFKKFTLFFLLCLFLGTGVSVHADSTEMRPPFGLTWGEQSGRIAALLKASKARITEKRSVNQREAWTVEGLTQPNLRRTIFYFSNDALVEIELQYEQPEWNALKYNSFFDDVKKRIELKYGVGQLLAQTTMPREDIRQKIIGYQWDQPTTTLQIFYFSAEQGNMAYRTVSLHYKMR